VAIFVFNYPMQFKYGSTSVVQNKATYLNEIELYVKKKHYAKNGTINQNTFRYKTGHPVTSQNVYFLEQVWGTLDQNAVLTNLWHCRRQRTEL